MEDSEFPAQHWPITKTAKIARKSRKAEFKVIKPEPIDDQNKSSAIKSEKVKDSVKEVG